MPQEQELRDSYPTMPILHWWTLRRRFKERIADIVPGIVTEKYVAGLLNMRESSVKTTIMPCLKGIGLLNPQGQTQKRLERWLNDQNYPDVCREILEDLYPEDLLESASGPGFDRKTAEKWFLERTGAGIVEVRKMIAFYSLLCDADPTKAPSISRSKTKENPAPDLAALSRNVDRGVEALSRTLSEFPQLSLPGLQFTFSINITPETTPEQIDTLVASLARHFKQNPKD